MFGQDLPDATASIFDQTFSLLVASIGLGTFALILALVEQVVLEVWSRLARRPPSPRQTLVKCLPSAFVHPLSFPFSLSFALQTYERNVRTGSAVLESNHILVLGWCKNQRDEEVIWKLLSQVPSFRSSFLGYKQAPCYKLYMTRSLAAQHLIFSFLRNQHKRSCRLT